MKKTYNLYYKCIFQFNKSSFVHEQTICIWWRKTFAKMWHFFMGPFSSVFHDALRNVIYPTFPFVHLVAKCEWVLFVNNIFQICYHIYKVRKFHLNHLENNWQQIDDDSENFVKTKRITWSLKKISDIQFVLLRTPTTPAIEYL